MLATRLSSLLARRCPRRLPVAPLRSFSLSLPRKASETPPVDPEMVAAFQKSSTFQKLSQSPTALAAIKNFAEVMQNSGIDVKNGQKPTTLQMLKLAANSDFREASTKMIEEFQKAGIDVNAKEVLEELQGFAKMLGSKK